MTTALLILLVLMDLGILVYVSRSRKRGEPSSEIMVEITEERRLLSELRMTVKEELEASEIRGRELMAKITAIATEVEMEVKSGGDTLAKSLEQVMDEMAAKIEEPLRQLSKKHGALENLLKRVEKERQVLQKALARGEKICNFFDQQVPYEEVLQEIQDKKYVDARHLLSRGMAPAEVARELGMPESEVNLLAAVV